ncbi:hypothetical protein Ccar_22565 [Clostridium carboxidivorans P7]|uniref:Ig domain protein n=1 Tax=Clostridium carboxidivorans P7 TaxID=536227 RepID=C6PXS5_9CLOT|nr:Ig-like domain-containing protein [Clostridium carboxidivorans]AKN33457.1 hypothetical protein Ccar_22565 [Clostridium carboxidivorans P7]EET85956.1 Ig domain protein [Clostridium carboxidivorans P7]EFG89159.1 bacterial Ig-like domain (group 4) [Clostridium carboxidivorans P7]
MNKNKKYFSVLSSAALGVLIASAVSSTASAKVTDYVAKDASGRTISFNLDALLKDYENKFSTGTSPMFDEYMKDAANLVAFKDDKTGLVSAKTVLDAYTDAVIKDGGKTFVLDTVTEAAKDADLAKDVTIGYECKADGTVDAVTPVDPSKVVKSVSAITATTNAGTVATLPSTVSVTLGDGTTKDVAITWSAAATTASTYATTGTVTVSGTLADYNNYAVSATVTVNGVLGVQSVTPINASQLVVTFNQAVDKTTAENPGSYTINGVAGDAAASANTLIPTAGLIGGAKLQADEKTVILTLNQTNVVYAKNKALAVVVNGVQGKNDSSKVVSNYASSVILNDTVAPTIASVTSKAITTTTVVKVKFSEPVKLDASAVYKINGEAATPAADTDDLYTVDLTTTTPLIAGQSYTLDIYNIPDTADTILSVAKSNKVTATQSFTVAKQDSTKGLQSATVSDDNKIVLMFADDMDKTSVEAVGNIKLLDEKGTALTAGTDFAVAQDSKDKKKATLTIDNSSADLYKDVNTRKLTLIVTDAVKDSLGNKAPVVNQAVTLTKDTVAPKATSARVLKNAAGDVTGFEVTYDANLKVSTPITTAIRAINASGKEITTGLGLGTSTGAVVATDQNKLTVSFTAVTMTSDISGQIKLILPEIATLVDDSTQANKAVATTLNVDLGASDSTGLKAAIANGVGDNKYTVTFNKAVDASSAINTQNYKLNGVVIPTTSVVTYDPSTKIATIEVPASFATKDDTSAMLTVSSVKSYDGTEALAATAGKVTLVDKVAPVLSSAVLNADNTLTITFDEKLGTAPVIGDLDIKVNGTTITVAGTPAIAVTAGVGSDAGKYTINLNGLIKYDGTSKTYLDLNADGTVDPTEPVFATSDITTKADNLLKNNALVTSITVGTKATGALTAADAASTPNKAKNGVVITVK